MYLHLYKTRVKSLVRNPQLFFWTLIFPILLGTLFYFGFSNMEESTRFSSIKTAIVEKSDTTEASAFLTTVKELSKEKDPMLNPVYTSEKKAKQMLKKGKVDGVYLVKDTPALLIKENGLNQSILEELLNQYLQTGAAAKKIASEKPEAMAQFAKDLSSNQTFLKAASFSDGNMDTTVQYFYALIAMACMYATMLGLRCSYEIQANLSALAARRSLSPTNKFTLSIVDFLGAITFTLFSMALILLYLLVILKIDFGNKVGFVILTSVIGSVFGVSLGLFIGSVGKKSFEFKLSVCLSFSMLFCFLAGLMVGNMRDIIEHQIPIINRLNPAALLADAFYSLNIYDNYDRYARNMGTLLIMIILLLIGNVLLIRRKKYASI